MVFNRIVLLSGMVSFALLMAAGGCGSAEESTESASEPVSPDTSAAAVETAPQDPAPEPPNPADAILGHWYTTKEDAQILLTEEDGLFGGRIVWLESPTYDEEGDEEFGQPRRDRNNPDEELQTRQIIGLEMIHGFTYDEEEAKWSGGLIYDPESGKTYKCNISLGEGDTLNVRGYIGIHALGRTEVWRRVPEGEEKTEQPAPTPSA